MTWLITYLLGAYFAGVVEIECHRRWRVRNKVDGVEVNQELEWYTTLCLSSLSWLGVIITLMFYWEEWYFGECNE